MIKIKEKYVTDAKGRAVGIVVDIKRYRRLLKQAEELEAIRAYDAAKISGDTAIPFEQAVKEIERQRR